MMKYALIFILIFSFFSCGENSSNLVDGVEDGNHRIFVTSTSYDGNLGGISGADSTCATHASNAGLIRTYKAVLSDSTSDIVNNLQVSGSVYIFSNSSTRELVASAASDLWNTDTQDLLNSIQYDEQYNSLSSITPWTGSDSDGTVALTGNHCTNWSANGSGVSGQVGSATDVDDRWLEGSSITCDNQHPLICISE